MLEFENVRKFSNFLKILRRPTDLLSEEPIKEEIFSVERLELFAEYLANELKIKTGRGRPLLPDLKKNQKKLFEVYNELAQVLNKKQNISPAAEWFVDNFHIIEDQLREIKQGLHPKFYHELPKLSSGELAGYPRVYAIALAFIAHTDCRIDTETLRRFVLSFQKTSPLTMGELWALPLTLRISLVDQIRPLAELIVRARNKREEADVLADLLLLKASKRDSVPEDIVNFLSNELGNVKNFDRAFVVQLTQRLRDQVPDVWPAFDWLENQLNSINSNTQKVIELEHYRQAGAQVTVGNIISSMRLISSLDWQRFFESISSVDPILSRDPSDTYSKMDFQTRDQYRHAIERITKRTGLNEIDVAQLVLKLAQKALLDIPSEPKRSHVGYYLIDRGVKDLEIASGYRSPPGERLVRFILKFPLMFYLAFHAGITIILLVPLVLYFINSGGNIFLSILFVFLALSASAEFSLTILNHYITLLLAPKPLPKMNIESGIPDNAKTMVLIPTLFSSEEDVIKLLENLQIHYLANQDTNIYFALLSDFKDASKEKLEEDDRLLTIAENGIRRLNNQNSVNAEHRFYLFHRKRLWNESENCWMGWERKRGKIEEFNRLLRGDETTSFICSNISFEFLKHIQYVITLDSDTELPRDSALQLIGTILHPLNQPRINPSTKHVVDGYGILQPRVSVSLLSANRSRFSKIFSGNTGLDPYSTVVSDVYQDMFGEGSFVGKGLYVVDAFQYSLQDRVPENTILSHDLFESAFARSGLVSNIELFDDYPLDFDSYLKRQHRWTRGDWQIANWLLPKVPTRSHNCISINTMSWLSRWKIFDNLRRSLMTPTILIWLILSWTIFPGSALVWTLLISLMLAFPLYAPVTNNLVLRRRGVSLRSKIILDFGYTKQKLIQIFFTLGFLIDLAFSQLDAISRTFYRKFYSKKNLLEWLSFAQTQSSKNSIETKSLGKYLNHSQFTSLIIIGLIAVLNPSSIFVAAPFLILWLISPALKNWTKGKEEEKIIPLGISELNSLRNYARKTWHFFEYFVRAEDNWLAPDNFQEDPEPVVAHRTSPTNIGMQLLSTSSAFDLGYLGLYSFVEQIDNTITSIIKMKKVNGHLLNWYNTQTLEPLEPQYISTVDSGNLAGHLITLKQSLIELLNHPLVPKNAKNGIIDTVSNLLIIINEIEYSSKKRSNFSLKHLSVELEILLVDIKKSQINSILDWCDFLNIIERKLRIAEDILNTLAMDVDSEVFVETRIWFESLFRQIDEFQDDLSIIDPIKQKSTLLMDYAITFERDPELLSQIHNLISNCEFIVWNMNFKFLFDTQRKIFVIGYNVSEAKRDNSFYDLLASESRLASFIAIAKGEVPKEHWFRLGRQITAASDSQVLVSWSATMFEYLMPLLVMRRYSDTLLDQTYKTVVKRQIQYGKQCFVPWGVSESAYNARDLQLNYQYGPFGIPGLGLKRGLADDLVVSPYSTFLALVVDPWSAIKNLEELKKIGVYSRFGFYESIDYTPHRLPKKQKNYILRSYMAHHQGMSLVSLNNQINDLIMQKRFHSEPLVQATQLILQERIPLGIEIRNPRIEELNTTSFLDYSASSNIRVYNDVHLPTPRTQILSNGTYSLMISTTGSGYSRCNNKAITRWREDPTRDHWGQFFYIKNQSNGEVWSTTYRPTLKEPSSYQVSFAEEKVEFWRKDGLVTTHTEIIVAPEDNVELRRISITNSSAFVCDFEVTSYSEVVLANPADDIAHPAFSNLFVQTEFISNENALLATRRRRSENESQIWGFHVLITESNIEGHGEKIGQVQYETDRSRFLGRGKDTFNPLVMEENRPLSDTVGAVLDPIFSLRQTLRIPAGETMWVTYATGVADSRDESLRLVDKYHDIHIFNRESDLAWTKAQVQLRHLNLSTDKAHTYQRLAGRVIYSDPSLRPKSHHLIRNSKAQSGLWVHGISGDLPIILTRISDEKDMEMVRELLHAHEYLRLKGVWIDLVILNERSHSYIQTLQEELQRQIRMSGSTALIDKPGGIFIRRRDIMSEEDINLLNSVARVSLVADKGTLLEQLKRRPFETEILPALLPNSVRTNYYNPNPIVEDLKLFNGLGGFSLDGERYVITLRAQQWTPAPWINVIANSHDFGFIISESGSSYTWSVNSRENRLTPWSNDAISDPSGESIYLRDEETGEIWTPTPLPIRDLEPYVVTHGQGFTKFQHTSHGIAQELKVFVTLDEPVKINRLVLKNIGNNPRKISVTNYIDWILGFERGASSPHVVTEKDPSSSAIFAYNSYNNEFAKRIAFVDCSEELNSYTCDRKEFIGRNGNLNSPAALSRVSLSGTVGAGFDPCAAQQVVVELAPGEEKILVFLLGESETREQVRNITSKYRNLVNVDLSFKELSKFWNHTLGSLQIKTPDDSMDILFNRWLLYQTLSCRIWARSAFYQSGGAFGFRDQLQDVMAMVYSKPKIAREQILRAAARQFIEGDVQHWWHPPTGRGVRTHCSDDLLWLPHVCSFYVNVTGDDSILNEMVSFIEGPELLEGQDDSYTQPQVSAESATLLEHCCRSLDRSLKVGRNGLPLMGAGDWNDGMNRVGHEGKGESVWMGWFLIATIKNFLSFCVEDEFEERRKRYEKHVDELKESLEKNAWDGNWYRRAFFDDGSPLGSANNVECRIDSLAQSWSVLSEAASKERSIKSMAAVDQHLIHRGDGLVKLFTPPFDHTVKDPGYIKGYLPGVRENGGQYTHAAIWTLMAFAKLGDGNRAGEIYSIINPINHSSTRANLHKYKVEPYVAVADIYALNPHVGRGGWTWYTGTASLMYRSAIESILGFNLKGDVLEINPCVPDHWTDFDINYKYQSSNYKISVIFSSELGLENKTIEVDGERHTNNKIKLLDDGMSHQIKVLISKQKF